MTMFAWLNRQRDAFGSPFLICCCCVYFGQGFRVLSSLSLQLWLKDRLLLDPVDLQWISSLAALPWSIKPLYGLASDARPIWGRRRKPYLILAAVIGVSSWFGLALLSQNEEVNQNLLLALLVLTNLSAALSDVIIDAMVAERALVAAKEGGKGNETGTEGEDALQTICWGSLSIGGLVGSGIGIAAISTASLSLIFSITALAPLLSLVTAILLPEKRSQGVAGVKTQITSLISALRQPRIHRPLAFFFLQYALVPSVSETMLFFATDVLKFSPEFLAAQGVISFLALLLGSVVYSRFISGSNIAFDTIFFYSQLALAVMSLGDLILVLRLNIAWGISDVAFVIGSDSVSTIISRLAMQSFFIIAARVCPEGCEAALYAFFMSTSNFGSTVSGMFGSFVTPYFNVSSGEYGGLAGLLAFRSACMILPLFLVRSLLADQSSSSMTEPIAEGNSTQKNK